MAGPWDDYQENAADPAKPWEEFGGKTAAPKPSGRTLAGTAKDIGISALRSAIAVPEVAVGLADIVSGGAAGKAAEEAGFRPKKAKAILAEGYSEPQKEAFQKVQSAEGLGDTLVAALQNPSVIGHSVVESLAPMAAGGVVARGGLALAGRTGAALTPAAGMVAGAAGEGVVGAGSAAEQIRQQTEGGRLTGMQSALAGASGVATAAFGMLGGKIAQKLGIADVDTMLAGAATNPAVRKGVVRSALEGALSEGVLEELPQSISEQVLQNAALGKPLDEGVDQAAVLGLLSGGVMGGGANLVSSLGAERPAAQPEPAAPAGSTPQAEPLALPSPTITVSPSGEALTADQRQALRGDVTDVESRMVQTPAEAMGLDASAGPVSKAAVHAVNSGLTQTLADAAQAAADEQAKGKEKTEGSFKTSDEAKKYISTQKRSGGASIQALPMPKKDGSFGIAIKGTPDYEIAAFHQKQETLRAAGVLDGDILTKSGDIFAPKQRGLAAITAKRSGKGFEAVPVAGGFVVRRAPESEKTVTPVSQPKKGPASAQATKAIEDQPPAPAAQTGAVAQAEPSAVQATGAGSDLVKIKTTQGTSTHVRKADLDGDSTHLRMFTAAGKPNGRIHRENLDPTGEKQAADNAKNASNPLFDVVTRKGGITFKDQAAAQRALSTQGLATTHEVVPANEVNAKATGFVIRKKTAVSQIDESRAQTGETVSAAPATPATAIDEAAHAAATSPLNDLPQPTQAQKEAGNYTKGHVTVQGLDISIENPQGSTRSGTGPTGPWSHVMSHHYGYIKRTVGADEEQVDVYVGPKPDSAKVFVVDQVDQQTGKFDEHKVMLGFTNQMQAAKAYRSNFDKGWKVGPIKAMTMDEFKAWLKDGDTSQPAMQDINPDVDEKAPQWAGKYDVVRKGPADLNGWTKLGNNVEGNELYESGGRRMVVDGDYVVTEKVGKPEESRYAEFRTPKEIKAAQKPAKTVVKAEVKAPAKPEKTNKMAEARTELLARRAAYFTPGNIVAGYSGFDEVLSYSPPDKNGDWSVKVHEVKKVGDQWVRQGKPQDARQHSTQPTAQQLARGPVDQLGSQTAAEVKYSEPRADGKPFPNAAPRGTEQPTAKVESAPVTVSSGLEDRRQEPRGADRRISLDLRKSVADMSEPELRQALLTDHLTGLRNRRAYDESVKLPTQVSIDADSLKWVNDNLGHESGDQLLKAIGQALGEETQESYHVSGDEFIVQTNTETEAADIMERARLRMSLARIEATDVQGKDIVLTGVGVSYGIAGDLNEAERFLGRDKAQRESQGLRAARGEVPPNATIRSRGEDNQARGAAAEEGLIAPTRTGAEAEQRSQDDVARGQESLFAKESTAAYTGAYETDLFGNPVPQPAANNRQARPAGAGVRGNVQPATGLRDTAAPAGEYHVNTIIGTESSKEIGTDRVMTAAQAAQATQYLYKSAVERFDAIVTDKNGKPLAIVGGFKGAIGQTSVYPATVMAEAIRIPGAANIWFSHNHPSGQSSFSRADENLASILQDTFRGSGIEPMGLLAVGDGKFSFVYDSNILNHGDPIPASTTKTTVPVMERQLGIKGVPGDVISGAQAAKEMARAYYNKAQEPGLMLLDSQHSVVGWIPVTKQMMGPLRGTGGAAAIYRAVSQSNAVAAIIVHGGELDAKGNLPAGVSASENIAAALAKIDARPLDSINAVTWKSAAESGLNIASGPMFAIGDVETAGLARAIGPARGMTVAAAQKVVYNVASKWKNGPRIVVVAATNDLPPQVKARVKGNPRGVYTREALYIVAGNNLNSDWVARTLAHEAIAHHGLRGLLGSKGHVQLMRRIHAGIAAGDKLLIASRDYVRKAYANAKLSPKDEADEIAAHVVEMAVDPATGEFKPGYGWLKMTFARIAAFLRRIGIDVKFTLAELHGMLVSSMKNLETGQRTLGGGGFVVASARREDAHLQAAEETRGTNEAVPTFDNASGNYNPDLDPYWLKQAAKEINGERMSDAEYHQAVADYANAWRVNSLLEQLGWKRRGSSNVSSSRYYTKEFGIGEVDPEYGGYDEYKTYEVRVSDHDDYHPVDATIEQRFKINFREGNPAWSDADIGPELSTFEALQRLQDILPNEPTAPESGGAPDILMALGTPADASAFANAAVERINSLLSAPGKVSWWHKSLGTMYNLAERAPAFKPVFEAAQNFINDVSFYATEAADLAPRILPKLESWADIKKAPIAAADNKAVSAPIFEGTLSWARDEAGKPVKVDTLEAQAASLTPDQKAQRLLRNDKLSEQALKMWRGLPVDQFNAMVETRFKNELLKPGVVFNDAELKSLFNLTPEQIGLYREFRTATDKSLDNLAKADMLRYGGEDVKSLRDQVMATGDADAAAVLLRDYLLSLAKEDPERSDVLTTTASGMIDRADKVRALKKEGYAPLSRFGQYTVDVVVDGERQYFSLFESAHAANAMANKMRMLYGKDAVTQGTLSNEAFKLFAGITPESLELFGNMLGLDSTGDQARDKVFQDYLKLTKTNRSAMRRLIHRKGIAGYSEDAGRVLASFVYSNARQTSAALHMGDLGEAITEIPKEQGELTDVAVKLSDYIKNPQEEAHAVRGLLFAQYLGGSIASAAVNMTQPLAVSLPYLSQFGGIVQSGRELARAYRDMVKNDPGYEVDLAAALRHAEETGIVSPQEVHQLMAQARGAGTLKSGDDTRSGNALAAGSNALSRLSLAWGKVFGMAEQLNRRTTFIAAYRIAKAQGIANPTGFAEKAVNETQFVYNKANKMQFGRGAIGGTLMTFKTYSISYLELMHRMYTQGGPEGKKAALLGIAVLMLLSGAGGLPFAEDAEDLVDGVLQRLGYNISSKKARQEFLEGIFGKAGAEFVDRGITGLPGVPLDVSGRLGMGNLIPGTGMFTEKRSHAGDIGEVVGPLGDFVKRLYEGGGQLLSGDVGKAALTVAPTAVRNVAKGVDMASSGMYRDTKGYKVLDTTGAEAAFKAIGFQPASVSHVQEANYLTQKAKDFYNMTAQDIRARWAKGIFEKDRDQVEQARAMLDTWNRNNPEQRMNANLPAILKKAREMGKSKEQRIADTAPKAMRMQLRQDLAQRRVEAQ